MCDDNSVELKDLTHRVLSSEVSAHSQSILPLEDILGHDLKLLVVYIFIH